MKKSQFWLLVLLAVDAREFLGDAMIKRALALADGSESPTKEETEVSDLFDAPI